MYRFDNNLDLSKLAGAVLNQICIGKHDVQFNFSSGVSIGVQSRVALYTAAGNVTAWSEDGGWSSVDFNSILNERIDTAEVRSETLLEFKFANQCRLQFFDESDQYESMTICGLYDDDDMVVI